LDRPLDRQTRITLFGIEHYLADLGKVQQWLTTTEHDQQRPGVVVIESANPIHQHVADGVCGCRFLGGIGMSIGAAVHTMQIATRRDIVGDCESV